MHVIERLLSEEQVASIVAGLGDEEFDDGAGTARNAGSNLKHNLQMRAGHNRKRLGEVVLQAMQLNPIVRTTAFPARYSFPMFSKYLPGMYYDFHTDAGVLNLGLPTALRTDLSCTIFLADPASYDGGELTVKSGGTTSQWKLPAGHAVLYRTSDLHRVEEVTRGARLAAVLWIQSHVRDQAQRDVLIRLNTACHALVEHGSFKAESDLLTASMHDLLRMWAA